MSSFQRAVLFIVFIFIVLRFAGGYADPARPALFEPGLAPLIDLVAGVFCKEKVQSSAIKNAEVCHPKFFYDLDFDNAFESL